MRWSLAPSIWEEDKDRVLQCQPATKPRWSSSLTIWLFFFLFFSERMSGLKCWQQNQGKAGPLANCQAGNGYASHGQTEVQKVTIYSESNPTTLVASAIEFELCVDRALRPPAAARRSRPAAPGNKLTWILLVHAAVDFFIVKKLTMPCSDAGNEICAHILL